GRNLSKLTNLTSSWFNRELALTSLRLASSIITRAMEDGILKVRLTLSASGSLARCELPISAEERRDIVPMYNTHEEQTLC
ncbi:MAG TPA: hypothetical protein VIH83_01465, partial [Candidatus Bathyarchaeia archaeon]